MVDWEVKPLGELFEIGSSKRVLKSQWQSSGVAFYRGREISALAAHGSVDNELFISEELFEEITSTDGYPKAGDIMVTAIGTIGNSYVVQPSDRFYFKDASVLWLNNKGDVDSAFINYWLKSEAFRGQLDVGNGATVDTLTIQKMRSVKVSVPRLSDQCRIVAILEEAFDAIATAKANTEVNLRNARELFEQQHDAIFANSEDGVERIKLGELATFRNGVNFSKQSSGLSVKIIGVKDFQNHFRAPLENLESVTLDGNLNPIDAISVGDIVTVRSNGNPELIGRCMVVGDLTEPVTHSGFTIRISVDRARAVPTYVCQFLRSRAVRRKLVAGGNGLNIKSLNQGMLAEIAVPLPPFDAQERCVARIETLAAVTRDLAELAARKLTALEELKKSLLHQAFTGQLTAKSVDRQLEAAA